MESVVPNVRDHLSANLPVPLNGSDDRSLAHLPLVPLPLKPDALVHVPSLPADVRLVHFDRAHSASRTTQYASQAGCAAT
jgi:hypothetical protein